MKTILLITAICVTTFCAAQETEEKQIIEKGTWNITGKTSINFSNSTDYSYPTSLFFGDTRETSSSSILITPSFGYAFKDNISLGLGLQYRNYTSEGTISDDITSNSSKSTQHGLGIAPYVRAYKGIGKQLSLYLQGEANYFKSWNSNKLNNQNDQNDYNINTIFIGIRPGITYFLNKKLAMEVNYGSLGYSFSELKYDAGNYSKNNNFNLNLNTSGLLFGVAYYF
ncbi:outer membrane beta-barrel protein [Maribacter sp. Asnod1-A12]|uniref:outer membrane beta-barrel protein n=1 Tax=Maribacter sp. Asnod1-A12 TaxID=3160576 RepID=UPI003866C208